jgi:hypothetical protein
VSAVTVDPDWLVERVAVRVVELLEARQSPATPALVDAATLARVLGVSRSTIYDRASELGAIEIGDSDRPRLRFDVERARKAWTRRVSSETPQQREVPALAEVRRRRRRSGSGSGVELLPVKPPTGGRAA